MGKKKGASRGTPTVEYHLSSHIGLCIGPVDAIHSVVFKDKQIATNVYRTGMDRIAIDERDLFGGPKKEGGIHGAMWFLPGHVDQVMPAELAAKLGGTPDTVPGFRRLASIFLVGNGWNNQPGFYQGSQLPSVIVPEVTVSRGARRLGVEFSQPPSPNGQANVNFAHAIYETLVDDDWGMGSSELVIDKPSFLKAAETLYYEGMGGTIYWTEQGTIESIVADILDVIDGMFFFNPSTGKAELKLLRNDYDVDELDIVSPATAKMVSFRRKLWGETTNEIIVEWTNPESEESETVTYQDLANIAMQGAVVSENRPYKFVRDGVLASKLAARDIARASQPLATCVLEVTRSQWKRRPGDVVKLTWPKYEIENLVMRVMEIDYGSYTDSKMRVTLLEDIFGLSHARYTEPPPSEWEEPGSEPEPLEVKVISTPKPVIDRFYDLTDEMYPAITPAFLAWSPAYDVNTFALSVEDIQVTGDLGWTGLGDRSTIGKSMLIEPLVQEVNTVLTLAPVVGGLSPQQGDLALIGEGTDRETELIMFMRDVTDQHGPFEDTTRVWEVLRGLWDTVPAEWPAGQALRILTFSFNAMDFTERLAFEDYRYRLQPHANLGTLDFENAPDVMVNVLDRPYLPFRPANVMIDGVMFGTVDWSEDRGLRRTETTVTWSNRHRNMEDNVPRHWDEADMAPEDGQTTEIVFLNQAKEEISRIVDLTGTSHTFNLDAQFTSLGEDSGYVKLVSRRDGMESLQGITLKIKFQPRGFGYDYGFGYGGWVGWEGQEGYNG